MNSANDELLDNDNRHRADRLSAKVKVLKSFAVDIEAETKEHNRLLDDVGEDFVGFLGNLVTGRNRINRLLDSGSSNRKFMCYLAGGILVFMFFFYYLLARSLSA